MFKKQLFLGLAIAAVALACSKTKTTDSGLTYEFLREGTGPKIDSGMVITLNFTQYMVADTGVVKKNSNAGQEPMPLRIQPTDGDLVMEGIMLAKEGDSIRLEFPATKLVPEGQPVPANITPDMKAKFELNIVKVYTTEQAFMEEMKRRMEEQNKKEEDIIAKYAADNKLTIQKTASGLCYAILSEGKGNKPVPGEMIETNYTGMFLDGKEFDSSVGKGTFKFPLGMGRVIPGWDEGFQLLTPGAKAVLLIPSRLAYGPQGSGRIPANSILRFDVELVKNLGSMNPPMNK